MHCWKKLIMKKWNESCGKNHMWNLMNHVKRITCNNNSTYPTCGGKVWNSIWSVCISHVNHVSHYSYVKFTEKKSLVLFCKNQKGWLEKDISCFFLLLLLDHVIRTNRLFLRVKNASKLFSTQQPAIFWTPHAGFIAVGWHGFSTYSSAVMEAGGFEKDWMWDSETVSVAMMRVFRGGSRYLCAGFLALVLFLLEVRCGSSACPAPCTCNEPTEVHCTFRSLSVIPSGVQPPVKRINLG